MSEQTITAYNQVREKIIAQDRRFGARAGKLCFAGADVEALAKKYGTPLYVFSEQEIIANIREIQQAFISHADTKICFASKACSVMSILQSVRQTGICAEANSVYEIRKCLQAGFSGDQIVYNGVVKKPQELEFAIEHELYLINIDSLYELEQIDAISRRLQKTANVCIRLEPNVPSATHPELVTAFHAKSGLDLEQAEDACRRVLAMPWVRLRGLHMHVGDQVPEVEPFAKATRVLVDEARRLEQVLGIRFEVINVGGGIPVPYKYDEENGDPLQDNMYAGITAQDFADAVVSEVHKWRADIQICIEPGRKVVGSAAVLLAEICCEKQKTHYDVDGNVERRVEWKFVDAGYSILPDSQHFNWFYYVYNASRINERHERYVKLAGPLCDGGDYFHIGVKEEDFLLPHDTQIGDIAAFLDTGAYSIESQTVYNNRPRTAVVMIDQQGDERLIRREDSYEDLLSYDIY
ncbi:diaminopimelate decarboxylase [Affinibrenneria salicis]|uniref:Diaminopimelate decarboxylase n=1 Tax=Affinibrenneria salicis TaxID=2590031 RepID=A0A5J5FYA7_9GAMM|nr:diaminopimelate decarboxylase [Affinibrenneria salicis]KAA8998877.1 diaminopimelate decarboxylase [Affinibrenneria salicis]